MNAPKGAQNSCIVIDFISIYTTPMKWKSKDRLNEIFDWIRRMEMEVSMAAVETNEDAPEMAAMDEDAMINADPSTMSEEAMLCFENKFVQGLLAASEAERTFAESLQQAIDNMPPEKRKWFYNPDYTVETLCGIFERYYTDFSIKVALGGSRDEAGERSIRNSGYQVGSALVSETSLWAYELIHDAICPADNKRAITLLGVTISCALGSMLKLTPGHEDLICPQIMKVEPQVIFMPKEKRTPDHILACIEAVSESDWERCRDIFRKSHKELVQEGRGRSDAYTII